MHLLPGLYVTPIIAGQFVAFPPAKFILHMYCIYRKIKLDIASPEARKVLSIHEWPGFLLHHIFLLASTKNSSIGRQRQIIMWQYMTRAGGMVCSRGLNYQLGGTYLINLKQQRRWPNYIAWLICFVIGCLHCKPGSGRAATSTSSSGHLVQFANNMHCSQFFFFFCYEQEVLSLLLRPERSTEPMAAFSLFTFPFIITSFS